MSTPFSSGWPKSHYEVLKHYHDQYEKDLAAGKFQPFVYPWGTFGAAVVILYLLIPYCHSPPLRRARFLAFFWLTGFAAYTIKYTRAKNMTTAFGIGLISGWSVLYVSAIMVFNDAQTDFQRIERLGGAFQGRAKSQAIRNESVNGSPNGTKASHVAWEKAPTPADREMPQIDRLGPRDRHGAFAWQPYPLNPFIERVDWILDVFCNFRGVGWNWRISGIPPPPKAVQEELIKNSTRLPSQTSHHSAQEVVKIYQSRSTLIRASVWTLVKGYLILDALKTLTNHDPYFWGVIERPPPSYFPSLLLSSPILIKVYRLSISMLFIKWALETIFALAPVFFSGILGPSLIGARAEAWMYPDTWGSYSVVLDRGLAGWWSGWWHQTFRFAFSEPSRRIIEILGLNPRSATAKLIQLFTAFGLSGFLHACGSYTQPGPSRPLLGPLRFFLLQAIGVFFESILIKASKRSGWGRRLPTSLKRILTFVYVHIWFYYTSPFLCDDFARGGIWLFEPVPISIFRGLGFGVKGDGWWCWGGQWASWYSADRWWMSGLRF